MNQYHADDPARSPVVMIGRADHRRLTRAALIDTSSDADRIDFLLYELDRAQVVEDDLLPSDIVRLGSIVRFSSDAHPERTIKLVLPEELNAFNAYRLSVTSMQGAALLGLRPGDTMSWICPDGSKGHVLVSGVANTSVRRG